MSKKDKEVSYDFSEVYKELPVEMRTRVNITASSLLEIQKGNEAFCDEGLDRFAEESEGVNPLVIKRDNV